MTTRRTLNRAVRAMRRTATVARPQVDLPPFVTRVYLHVGVTEVDLVDRDTGMVVYTTPKAWRTRCRGVTCKEYHSPEYDALGAAKRRAFEWAERHKLAVVEAPQ